MKFTFSLFILVLLFIGELSAQNFYLNHPLTIPGSPLLSQQIEFGDFNNDGYQDLFSVDYLKNELDVYVNKGGVIDSVPHKFSTNLNYQKSHSIPAIYLSDWNHDGFPDVLYVTSANDSLCIFLNNKSGGFTFSAIDVRADSINQVILVKDINNDSYPDISWIKNQSLCVLENQTGNTSNISFHKCLLTVPGNSVYLPQYFCMSDFDHSGKAQLITGFLNSSGAYRLYTFKDAGNYNYQVTGNFFVKTNNYLPHYIGTKDLDKDGTEEVIIRGKNGNDSLYVYRWSSAFKLKYQVSCDWINWSTLHINTHGDNVTYYDFDNNGYVDLLVDNHVLFNNNSALTPHEISSYSLSYDITSLSFARIVDADKDGKAEIWWYNSSYLDTINKNNLQAINYTGGQNFNSPIQKWTIFTPVQSAAQYQGPGQYVDMNNDGLIDYVYQSNGMVVLSINQGNFTFKERVLFSGLYRSLIISDFNNDGLMDVVGIIDYNYYSQSIRYFVNRGNLTFKIVQNLLINNSNDIIGPIGVGDFNKDGKKDILLLFYGQASLLSNNGSGFNLVKNACILASKYQTYLNYTFNFNFDVFDLNNDSLPDMVYKVYNGTNYDTYFCINNGNNTFTSHRNSASFGSVLGLTDMNGDGYPDFLVNDDIYSSIPKIGVETNDKTGKMGLVNDINDFRSGYDNILLDVNNDGRADIVSFDQVGSNTRGVYLNNGTNFEKPINQSLENFPSLLDNHTSKYWPYKYLFDVDHDGDMDIFYSSDKWSENLSITCPPLSGAAVTPASAIICPGTAQVLTLNGVSGVTMQWQISADNIIWNNVSSGGNSGNYTTQVADGVIKKYYRCLLDNGCYTTLSNTVIVDISNPNITVTVSNITDNSATLKWSPVGSGNYTIGLNNVPVAVGVTPPETITGLVAGSTYTITVTQTSPVSCPASGGITITTLCAAPSAVSVTSAAANSLNVSWVGSVGNYRVYYTQLFTTPVVTKTKDVPSNGALLSSLQAGATYAIYVVPLDCPTTGQLGQPSSIVYGTTTSSSTCAAPTIDSVKSICSGQLQIWMHGSSSNIYQVYLQRLTPTVQASSVYTINGGNFSFSTGAAGQTYSIAAAAVCNSVAGKVTTWPSGVTVPASCNALNNLLLSQPTCTGFTASWNADNCSTNTLSAYQLSIKKQGALGWNSYTVLTNPQFKVLDWLAKSTSYQCYVRSAYSCNGYSTYGPSSAIQTIATLSAACRIEGEEAPEENPTTIISNNSNEIFSLYPNPNTGQFFIDLSRINTQVENVRIEVLNMMGQTVLTQLTGITNGHLNEYINLPANTAPGMYFVRVIVGNSVYMAKVNVQQ